MQDQDPLAYLKEVGESGVFEAPILIGPDPRLKGQQEYAKVVIVAMGDENDPIGHDPTQPLGAIEFHGLSCECQHVAVTFTNMHMQTSTIQLTPDQLEILGEIFLRQADVKRVGASPKRKDFTPAGNRLTPIDAPFGRQDS